MWGPLVLAGDLSAAPEPVRPTERTVAAAPALVTERPVGEWLKPVANQPGRFRTERVGFALDAAKSARDVELAPFYTLHRRTYSVYWNLFTADDYNARLAQLAKERAAAQQLEAASVAFVPAGEPDAEKPFNPRGEDISVVHAGGRPGRRSTKWFSVRSANRIAGAGDAGRDLQHRQPPRAHVRHPDRCDESRRRDSGEEQYLDFVDVRYPVPADVLQNKNRVVVRFEATGGNEIAPVFGVRLVRSRG